VGLEDPHAGEAMVPKTITAAAAQIIERRVILSFETDNLIVNLLLAAYRLFPDGKGICIE